MLVSLDQVLRKNEMQKSPRNSPAEDPSSYNHQNNKRLPVIRRATSHKCLSELEKATGTDKDTQANDAYHNELSSMDLTGVCSLDEDMSEICDDKHTTETYFSSLDDHTMDDADRSIGDYLDCPTSLSASSPTSSSRKETADLEDNMTTEYRAPFIPPPLGDSQFAVDEKELEIFNINNPLCYCEDITWKAAEAWDANSELDKDRQRTFIKRNLSTPTFFPLAEKINPEP